MGLGALGVVTAFGGPSEARSVVAAAELRDANGEVVGVVRFVRQHGEVVGRALVQLPPDSPTFHGFHVHANDIDSDGDGNPADGCVAPTFAAVDGHWDDGTHTHGAHLGDMPSLQRDADGHARVEVSLGSFAPSDVIGRAVVVHAGPDNFANIPERYTATGPDATTLGTGDSGARFACGVVVAARR
jgi:Cu-Zn family superoxide dismutase